MEPIYLHDGRLMRVHSKEDCIGPHCCIHNPSDHPLNTAPLDWWEGVGMMRRCTHGVVHPDPDDLDSKLYLMDPWAAMNLVEAICSVHLDRCDGCCYAEEDGKEDDGIQESQ